MRLKRGKEGDTGVVVPPRFPESIMAEPSMFDDRIVEEIVNMVDTNFWGDNQMEQLRRAIKLTMATQSWQQVMALGAAPPPPPALRPGGPFSNDPPDPPPSQARMPRRPTPPPDLPIGTSPPGASVHSISVSITHPSQLVNHMNGSMVRVSTGAAEVTVEVRGGGDPVTMLRQAADRFHDNNLTSISTRNF